jgi:glycosyltransferase involved in cell wall biosynthesis
MLGRSAGLFADRFFCLSQDIASELASFGITARRKIRVIPNGIDLTRFQSEGSKDRFRAECGLPAGVPIVGTIGRLVPVKRQDMLIRSFAGIKRQFPEAHLVLVGDGPLVAELRALSARLGLSHCIRFTGYQSHPERYLRAMDVFALTSQSEGMPQVIMEAAAAGIPVIATRVGGVPEMIEHGESGLLVAFGDEAALTAGVCNLLANQELAQRLSQAAKASVAAQFDVRRMAADYHRQLSELVSRKARPPRLLDAWSMARDIPGFTEARSVRADALASRR